MSHRTNARLVSQFACAALAASILLIVVVAALAGSWLASLIRDQGIEAARATADQVIRAHRWAVSSPDLAAAGNGNWRNVDEEWLGEMVGCGDPGANYTCRVIPPDAESTSLDAFERGGLAALRAGAESHEQAGDIGGDTVYRIMRLTHHPERRSQTRPGNAATRPASGAIVINYSMGPVNKRIKSALTTLIAGATATLAIWCTILVALSYRLASAVSAAEARLTAQACVDPLTGVLNRRALFQQLELELSRTHRSSSPLSCVLLDIDNFRQLNERHGPAAGDRVLREVGRLLQSTCRRYDAVGRYGGEEFLILAPATHANGACTLAERIRDSLAQTPIACNGESVRVTASLGVTSTHHGEIERIEEIVSRADRALGRAKGQGRNRVGLLE